MQTARFRIWLQAPYIRPVWTGVKFVWPPEYIAADVVDVVVEGDGNNLKRLVADHPDIFAAYLQFLSAHC